MERVQHWREPAVVVVVVVLLIRLVLVVSFAVSTLWLGVNGAPDAAYLASRQLADPTPYIVLAALVLSCHLRPVTPRARALAGLGAGVAGVGLLLVLGLAVYGYTTYSAPFSQLDLADRLAAAVVPLLAVLVLVLLATAPTAAPSSTDPERLALPAAAAEPSPEPAKDPALEPTWSPDAAAGAAWTTAGEAASGRPATQWGTAAGTSWESPELTAVTPPAETPADQQRPSDSDDDPHPWSRPAR